MESLLQGVANSSRPQDVYVFVSVCVWEVGEVTTGSSPQPWSTLTAHGVGGHSMQSHSSPGNAGRAVRTPPTLRKTHRNAH